MATMEDASRSSEVQVFDNIPQTESAKPGGFDANGANLKVSKLFNVTGTDKRIGPVVVIKVMAGDKFKALVKGWYMPGSTNVAPLTGASSIVTNLVSAFGAAFPGASKFSGTDLTGSGILTNPLTDFITYQGGQNVSTRPKAYLNWMVLDDEQLKMVNGNYGVVQVPDITGTMPAQLMQSAAGADIDVKQNGYLFVFVSNESQGNVYFDDLRLEHTAGPLTEEFHYYPGGLMMAGISSQALDKDYITNRLRYQSQEYEGGFDLNMNEFDARMYDPQLCRWVTPDPANQYHSQYVAMGNNWPNSIDPDGRIIPAVVAAILIGATISAGTYVTATLISGEDVTWKGFARAALIGAAGGAIGAGFTGLGAALGSSIANSTGYSILSNVSTNLAVDLSFGNKITFGSVIGAVIGGVVDGQFSQFKGFSHKGDFKFVNGLKNGAAELGINIARGGAIGGLGGAIGAAVDGKDIGKGFLNGARSGAIGAGIRTAYNQIVLGVPIKPNGSAREKLEQMEYRLQINILQGRGTPVFRTGGIIQRGLTFGRFSLVGTDTEGYDAQKTWIHEAFHYYQQVRDSWMQQSWRGMYEQWWLDTFKNIYPYTTKGTYEYEADKFTDSHF